MQPARQDRRLDDGRLRPVEPPERRVGCLMHDAAVEARPLMVLPPLDFELGMGEPRRQHRAEMLAAGRIGQSRRPVRQPAKISTSSV